jgi:hypothetical protein
MSTMYLNPQHPRFDLADPRPEQFDRNDITLALYGQKRFLGRTARPYSVLEHSIFVARLAESLGHTHLRAHLWHDGPEAYTGDVPAPVKAFCGSKFRTLEAELWVAMARAFDIAWSPAAMAFVKEADRLACVIEQIVLLPGVVFSADEQARLATARRFIEKGIFPRIGSEPDYGELHSVFLALDEGLSPPSIYP